MTSEEKDFLLRVAPAYITAALFGAYSFFEIRKINQQRKQSQIEHLTRMADMKVAANERIERYLAWRKAQPTVEEIMKKAEEEIGSVEELRRKLEDPNYVFKL